MPTEKTTGGVTYTDYQSDTPESLKNEKRALLASLAEHGTAGQAEYERNKQLTSQTRNASIERAAARGLQVNAPGTLAAELAQDQDAVIGGLIQNTDDGMLSHGREMDRISAANAAWFDQSAHGATLNQQLIDAQLLAQAQAQAASSRGGSSGGGSGGGGGGGSFAQQFAAEQALATESDTGATGPSLMDIENFAVSQGLPADGDTLRTTIEVLAEDGDISKEWAETLIPYTRPDAQLVVPHSELNNRKYTPGGGSTGSWSDSKRAQTASGPN